MPILKSKQFICLVSAMVFVVVASNILVQYPFEPFGLNELLTWGAFTYPLSFLVTDLTNRRYGLKGARLVVAFGFVLAVILSIYFATPRIAIASGLAFLSGQFLDITIFNWLREAKWWRAPLISSVCGSIVDTGLFFAIAFIGTDLDLIVSYSLFSFEINTSLWVGLAFGDLMVKLAFSILLLIPYSYLRKFIPLMAKSVSA